MIFICIFIIPVKISIYILYQQKNQQLVRLSVVILFDWFSKTKAKVLKCSTARECVLCVCMLDKEGRTLGVSSIAIVLYNIYIYIVVVWMAMCLTGYSDYLTGYSETLSTSYICDTGLKTVYRNRW